MGNEYITTLVMGNEYITTLVMVRLSMVGVAWGLLHPSLTINVHVSVPGVILATFTENRPS